MTHHLLTELGPVAAYWHSIWLPADVFDAGVGILERYVMAARTSTGCGRGPQDAFLGAGDSPAKPPGKCPALEVQRSTKRLVCRGLAALDLGCQHLKPACQINGFGL